MNTQTSVLIFTVGELKVSAAQNITRWCLTGTNTSAKLFSLGHTLVASVVR